MSQTIRYAVKYAEQTITDAEYDLIYALYNFGEPKKIHAIKFLRAQ